jgi:glycosyltransferase involved in cell wall biosynthesis
MSRITPEELQRRISLSYERDNHVCICMPNPILSVRIATYQHAHFIAQCLDSVICQQTDFPFEIIIGDDCSTDGTREIVFDYADRYPEQIRVFTADMNVGIKANGQRIRNACRGKYIALLEGDDYWCDPLKLQKQVDFMEANPDYALCYHDFTMLDAVSGIMQPSPLSQYDTRDADTWTLQTCDIWIQTLTICHRNVLHEMEPENLHVLNGDNFWISLLGAHGKGKWLGDVIEPGVYRQHAGGIWSALDEPSRIAAQMHSYFWIARYHLRTGNIDVAKRWKEKVMTLAERGMPVPEDSTDPEPEANPVQENIHSISTGKGGNWLSRLLNSKI